MSITTRWTVIGIFEEQDKAKHALGELQEAGFSNDQIGFVYRDGVPVVSRADVEAEENAGGFTSGIIGGILGAADALLTPVLGPSTANTIPTTMMPVAEQTIERLQTDGEHDAQHEQVAVAEPLDDEGTQDTVKMRRLSPTQNGVGESAGNVDAVDTMGETPLETQEEAANDAVAASVGTPVETQEVVPEGRHVREEEATGAFTGGVVGGLLGATVALLIPVLGPAFAGGILVTVFSAALGAMAGGFLGAFAAIGVPEEQARHYEEEFKAGRTIVTVKTEDRQQDALDIFYRNGVHYANTHSVL
ncbi:MAG: hypothetical protein ACR2H5_26060 [Ktedonobacteraceae bacterium]